MKQIHTPSGKLNAIQISELILLHEEGWNNVQLGERFGVTRQAVYRLLLRRGLRRVRWPKHNGNMLRDEHGNLVRDETRMSKQEERDSLGVIVTLRNQRDGEIRSVHVPGLRMDALRWLCEKLDLQADDWRVICYSTPETILGDLQHKHLIQPERASENAASSISNVEAGALGRIKRLDRLDPSIIVTDARDTRKRKPRKRKK